MRVSIILIGLGLVLGFSTSLWAVEPAIKCESDKVKEAAKYAFCLGKEEAKAIKKGIPVDTAKCDTKFSAKW